MSIACTYAAKQRTDSKKPIVDLDASHRQLALHQRCSRNSPLRLQSTQSLFSGRFTSSRSVFVNLSVVSLSCFDDMVDRVETKRLLLCFG